MTISYPYTAQRFDLRNLHGTSEKTLAMHYKLYEGYVKGANLLTKLISKKSETASSNALYRLNFEYGGMKLHEYYFSNLQNGDKKSRPGFHFKKRIKFSFATLKAWQTDFINTAAMRGVGWAVCCANPVDGKLSNHWISLHDLNSLANLEIVLVLDVWEHAFLLDYQPSARQKYIKDFFANVNWNTIEARLKNKM